MFIDIHAHAYRIKPTGVVGFCTAEELIAEYDRLGIAMGVVLPIVSPEIYMPQTNEDVLEMAQKYPDRLIAFCNVDPRMLTNSPDAPLNKIIEHYKKLGCRGVGEVMPNMALMDPMVQNLFRHAEDLDMAVIYDGSDVLTGDFGLYDDPGLPQLEHTLQRFPKLKLFGHGPVFWAEIGKLKTPGERGFIFDLRGGQVGRLPEGKIEEEGVVATLFRRYPNLCGDLSDFTAYSAFARDDVYGPAFMTEFQDRLYFGTDMCFPGMPTPMIGLLNDWRDAGKISKMVYDKISHQNAAEFLGIEV